MSGNVERRVRRGREDRNESVADSKDERITEGRKVEKRRKERGRGGRDGRRRRTTRAFIGHLSN